MNLAAAASERDLAVAVVHLKIDGCDYPFFTEFELKPIEAPATISTTSISYANRSQIADAQASGSVVPECRWISGDSGGS